ncbi:MAG: AhpC/TSA family protein [Bacteroidales bacterium]|jgi:thiol-disulfide isomerase/thioredoxin|nr:AhpC/TSA family protein [Bacteroidales bacterium]
MNRFISILIATASIMCGCKSKVAEISGTLENPVAGQYIYLDELLPDQLKTVDSVLIGADGRFGFKKEVTGPSFCILRINNSNSLTMLLEPGDNITMNALFDSLSYPSALTGSKSTGLMVEYNLQLRNSIKKFRSLSGIYAENIENPELYKVVESLDSLASTYMSEINTYTKNYIDQNLTSLVSLVALYQQIAPNVYVMNPSQDLRYFIKVDSALSKNYPNNELVKSLHEQIVEMAMAIESRSANSEALMNMEVPDIALPAPGGDTVKLSSTRGSVVLLDFWASWCEPCRMENPNLVKAYNTYRGKGFQIYQVSLDKTREAWVKGIEEDRLGRWIHVSDLKFWNSPVVAQYKIQSIPGNYLLDKDGRVIAVNLRGEALDRKLAEIFQQ